MFKRPYPGYGVEQWTEWLRGSGPHELAHRVDHWLVVQVIRHPKRVRTTDKKQITLPPRGKHYV